MLTLETRFFFIFIVYHFAHNSKCTAHPTYGTQNADKMIQRQRTQNVSKFNLFNTGRLL